MSQPTLQQTLELAIRHHQSGRLAEAEMFYRQLLALEPERSDVLQRLGLLAHQHGNGNEALELLRRAVELNPHAADCHSNLGAVLASQRDFEQAIVALRKAIELRPDLPAAHFNLANALKETGRPEEASDAYRQALSLRSDNPEAWHNLGGVLQASGKLDEATAAYRRAIDLRPEWGEAYNNLGSIHHKRGDLERALSFYRRAAALAPAIPEIHNNLSTVLQQAGRLEEGIAAARAALSLRPEYPEAHVNLGNALRYTGQSRAAISEYQQAISHRPGYAEAHYNLASAFKDIGELDAAIASYWEAIRLRPDYGEAYGNLAGALRDAGELDESIANYRKAAELTKLPWIAGNLLYTLYFHPDYGPREIYEEHARWNETFAEPFAGCIRPHANDRAFDRPLRIGYVSPDFREHAQSHFTLPLLSRHDHERYKIFCYSNVAAADSVTERIKGCADAWRDITKLSDDRAADLVREDRIDILVDLTMHMRRSRLLVFARKPAPVQVTWLAYPGTTGLTTVDYRLSDPYLDPTGEDEPFYSEKTVRLPDAFWCYDPLASGPDVNPLPALQNGFVSFGCLNNFAKVTDLTLDLWARVLNRVSNSRLILLAPRGSARRRVLDKLHQGGIEESRVEFIGRQPRPEYLRTYHRIDLCLDTFPCNGHTTTLDSLWMGVPTITIAGRTAISRGGLSILSNLGLQALVAGNADAWVETASRMAEDLSALKRLRAELRSRLEMSPLMDGLRFARNVESVYGRIWRNWCEAR